MVGTMAWKNLHNAAKDQAAALAGSRQNAQMGAVVFIHGESGPRWREDYADMQRGFVQQLPASPQETAGQPRKPVQIPCGSRWTRSRQPRSQPSLRSGQPRAAGWASGRAQLSPPRDTRPASHVEATGFPAAMITAARFEMAAP